VLDLSKLKRNVSDVEACLAAYGSEFDANGIDYISLQWQDGEVIARDRVAIEKNTELRTIVEKFNQVNVDNFIQTFIKFSLNMEHVGDPQCIHFRWTFCYITIYIVRDNRAYYALTGVTKDIGPYKSGHAITVLEQLSNELEKRYAIL